MLTLDAKVVLGILTVCAMMFVPYVRNLLKGGNEKTNFKFAIAFAYAHNVILMIACMYHAPAVFIGVCACMFITWIGFAYGHLRRYYLSSKKV